MSRTETMTSHVEIEFHQILHTSYIPFLSSLIEKKYDVFIYFDNDDIKTTMTMVDITLFRRVQSGGRGVAFTVGASWATEADPGRLRSAQQLAVRYTCRHHPMAARRAQRTKAAGVHLLHPA